MFNFFANLALAVYSGTWLNSTNNDLINAFIRYFKVIPIFNIFNNSSDVYYQTSTNMDFSVNPGFVPDLVIFVACILAGICCIWVFFFLVKSMKYLITIIPNALTGRI